MFRNYVMAVFLLAAAFATGAAQAGSVTKEEIEKGRQEYQARCLHCHGESADGKGHLIGFLKVTPANLTKLRADGSDACVAERVLKAVLGRHTTGTEAAKMPLLSNALTPESIYFISEYIKTIQK